MAKLDVLPIAAVKNSALPFRRVVPMPRAPTSDLPKPFVSEPVRESEPDRYFANPLLSDPARESDALKDLESTT